MGRAERLELRDHLCLAAELEVGLDPFLESREAELFEPCQLTRKPERVRNVGKRRPPPERERLVEEGGGCLPATLPCCLRGILPESFEADEIEAVAHVKHVARLAGFENTRRKELPQARDVAEDDLSRGCRRPLAPEVVDKPFDRHHSSSLERQYRQHETGLPRGDRKKRPVARYDLEWA